MKFIYISFIYALIISGCKTTTTTETIHFKFAFGSCAHQDKDQPMLQVAADLNPDAFIFLGDNIYGDSREMDTLIYKYGKLGSKKEYQNLWDSTSVFSIWDDHDFGENDAGRHYPFKAASKEIFMDFWKVPVDSDRRKHKGIYGVEYFKKGDRAVQLILLDTRTFRDNLIFRDSTDTAHKNDYIPNPDPDSTILGDQQWEWLEQQFLQPADVRIIASSIQFSHEYNGYESWTNVPQERNRMIQLIQKTKANGVIFISGDVHWGEISRQESESGYPIYDVTSSGITETWHKIEPNERRVGEVIPQNNVGVIEAHFDDNESMVRLMIYDTTAIPVVSHEVGLEEISY